MQKAERDALITQMTPGERQNYFQILQGWQARIAATDSPIRIKQLFDELDDDVPETLRIVLAATVERDEMGPKEGEIPPDFTLKQLGSDNTVQLSSFRDQRPVALVFGSYT